MLKLSKSWQIVSSLGHGVLLALALSGLVRIGGALTGRPVSPEFAGNIFLLGCLVFAPLTAAFNTCRLMMPPTNRVTE